MMYINQRLILLSQTVLCSPNQPKLKDTLGLKLDLGKNRKV